jgi:hypothetical protein
MATVTDIINQALDTAPELQGTPKQIAWADTLVEKFIDQSVATLRRLAAAAQRNEPGASIEQVKRGLARFKIIIGQKQASWWINHRDDNTAYLLFEALNGELKN